MQHMKSKTKLSVVILEDEFFVASHLKGLVHSLGYNVHGLFKSGEEFLQETDWSFDAALVDVFLSKKLSGLDIGKLLNEKKKPFIFLTANQDKFTLKKAAALKPKSYIGKPFKDLDVEAALEILFLNQHPKIGVNGSFGIKEIAPSEILFIKTDKNYLDIVTQEGTFHHRSTLKDITQLLPDFFIQVNRFTIVNSYFIEQRNASQIKIAEYVIPISRNYRGVV